MMTIQFSFIMRSPSHGKPGPVNPPRPDPKFQGMGLCFEARGQACVFGPKDWSGRAWASHMGDLRRGPTQGPLARLYFPLMGRAWA